MTNILAAGHWLATLLVVASCGCGMADSSATSVQSSGGPDTTSILISPRSVTLATGEVYQLSSTVTFPDGTTSSTEPVTYRVTQGYVTARGQLQAARQPGNYNVMVQHSSGARDSATVMVIVPATPYFEDGFESGDLKSNHDGFRWAGGQGGAGGDEMPIVTGALARPGAKSLRFRFVGGPTSDDAWSEQRFRLGRKLSEVYISFSLYIPGPGDAHLGTASYRHRDDPAGPINNKVFRLWDVDYNRSDVQFGFSTRLMPGGLSRLTREWLVRGSDGRLQENSTGNAYPEWITDQDRGHWIQVQIRGRLSRGPNADDGLIQVWKNGRLVVDQQGMHFWSDWAGANNYFLNGYLLGWANSGFDETTHLYVDDVVISATPIP